MIIVIVIKIVVEFFRLIKSSVKWVIVAMKWRVTFLLKKVAAIFLLVLDCLYTFFIYKFLYFENFEILL